MTNRDDLASFTPIKRVLDAVLAAGGGLFTVTRMDGEPSARQAVNWRQRAYTFRKRWREEAAKLAAPGQVVTTPYDDIKITLACGCTTTGSNCRRPADCGGHTLKIAVTPSDEVHGELRTLDGAALPLGKVGPMVVEVDETMRAALQVRKDLGMADFEE